MQHGILPHPFPPLSHLSLSDPLQCLSNALVTPEPMASNALQGLHIQETTGGLVVKAILYCHNSDKKHCFSCTRHLRVELCPPLSKSIDLLHEML